MADNWESVRLLLKSDGMGFSMHVTTIHANTITPMWYQNHLEAVLCIEGEGEIEETDKDCVYPIKPGTLYALDTATGEMRWEYAMGGPAYSSPSVAGDVVYAVTEVEGQLIAFNRTTGDILWTYTTGGQGDWRSSAPVLVDDVLYIGSNTQGLLALTAPDA